MKSISAEQSNRILKYSELIPALREAFCTDIEAPDRLHYQYPSQTEESTLLLMPSWSKKQFIGVKIVTVTPENRNRNLPSIHGIYLVFDAITGIPLYSIDGQTLTKKRTAAASALASSYLSRKNSSKLTVIGTGALSKELIEAHCTVRPISEITLVGRSIEKAQKIARELPQLDILCTTEIEKAIKSVDIISCATTSPTPLIHGDWLQEGQHIDLVGSYLPSTREADDISISRSSIYVDTIKMASKESGDIKIPLDNGLISMSDIKADLFSMCEQDQILRKSDHEITLFKSVGHALEDLAAAQLILEKMKHENI